MSNISLTSPIQKKRKNERYTGETSDVISNINNGKKAYFGMYQYLHQPGIRYPVKIPVFKNYSKAKSPGMGYYNKSYASRGSRRKLY